MPDLSRAVAVARSMTAMSRGRGRTNPLDDFTRDELVALVERMIARYPDLAALLEHPRPGRDEPVDEERLRAQVRTLYDGIRFDDWRASGDVAARAGALLDDALAHRKWGGIATAVSMLTALVRGLTDGYGDIRDEESEIGQVVDEALDALGSCIAAAEPTVRTKILDVLVEVTLWDRLSGGYGIAERVPEMLVEHATAEERKRLASRIESALRRADSIYCREAIGRFFLHVAGDAIKDDKYLAVCRDVGLHPELVDRLLAHERLDEAARVLVDLRQGAIRQVAEVFVKRGHAARAEKVLGRLAVSTHKRDLSVLDWLLERAEAREDRADAARWATARFRVSRSLHDWAKVSKQATAEERRALAAELEEQRQWALLVGVELAEGNIQEARRAWKHAGGAVEPSVASSYAAALAREYPDEAFPIWTAAVDREVKAGNRSRYRMAAGHVNRAIQALKDAKHAAKAAEFVLFIRERHASRPAFLDELEQAMRPR